MQMIQTLALVVLLGLALLLGWLVYLLIRQHGQLLLDQDKLEDRLAAVEHVLEVRADGVQPPRVAPPKPGWRGQDSGAAGVLYRTVTLKNGSHFEVAVDPRLIDPISRGVVDGNFWFLHDFYPLLDLMRSGDTVLDLGGHIGTFSLAAAALGCHVVCVEAAPDNAALLRASVARNGFDHMVVVQAVATDQEGTVQFLANGPWGAVSNAAVARSPSLIYSTERAPVTTAAVTIDGLLGKLGCDQVNFVKADIEGSEMAAIRGMTRLLARPDAPVLLYESNGHALHFFGETPDRLVTTLRNFGYTSYRLEPGCLVPIQQGELQTACVINCLAVKGQPPLVEGWPIKAPRSLKDTVHGITSECRHADEHHRAYIARALAQAEPGLRSDPRVVLAARSLCSDASPAVRSAAESLLEDLARDGLDSSRATA
jgi:FkbM family methyltransferase